METDISIWRKSSYNRTKSNKSAKDIKQRRKLYWFLSLRHKHVLIPSKNEIINTLKKNSKDILRLEFNEMAADSTAVHSEVLVLCVVCKVRPLWNNVFEGIKQAQSWKCYRCKHNFFTAPSHAPYFLISSLLFLNLMFMWDANCRI